MSMDCPAISCGKRPWLDDGGNTMGIVVFVNSQSKQRVVKRERERERERRERKVLFKLFGS
jgi:hypothetical protein